MKKLLIYIVAFFFCSCAYGQAAKDSSEIVISNFTKRPYAVVSVFDSVGNIKTSVLVLPDKRQAVRLPVGKYYLRIGVHDRYSIVKIDLD